jgi:ABC-type uncharacterized transport system ATPase subunit
MNKISDGQRRRVKIVLGLLQPWKILVDEVTVDLDGNYSLIKWSVAKISYSS